jgi:hypothetical protein
MQRVLTFFGHAAIPPQSERQKLIEPQAGTLDPLSEDPIQIHADSDPHSNRCAQQLQGSTITALVVPCPRRFRKP